MARWWCPALIISLDVLLDPKSAAAGMTDEIITEQVALSLKVVDLQSEAKKMLAEINDMLKPLEAKYKKKASARTKAKIDKIEAVKYQLETQDGIYMRPMLVAQLSYLSSMLNRADQKPGKDAYARYEELKAELDKISKQFRTL